MFRKKVLPILLLPLCILLAFPCLFAQAAGSGGDDRPVQTLLMYDSLSHGTRKEGNVEALQRLLASFDVQVTLKSFDKYEPDTLKNYDDVIVIRNAPDLTGPPAAYLTDLQQYRGRYLHIGAQLPEQAAQALKLREEPGGQAIVRLKIGPFTGPSIRAELFSSIVGYEGKAYGSWSSSNRPETSPYGVVQGRYGYVPFMEKGDLSEIAVSYLLRDWLGASGESRYYAVFKEIYPFSDLDMLRRMADRLYESGIPFMASVRPVLDNFDYPAVQRYLETLKYVQSRNGTIVVHAPFVASTISQDYTTLKKQMSAFVNALAEYGIAPLAVGAEMYWTYDEHYASQGMDLFDSVVMFANERIVYRTPTDRSKTFASLLYSLEAGKLQAYGEAARNTEPLPMDAALVFDFPRDEKQFRDTLAMLQNDWRTFADYKNSDHSVRTDRHEIESAHGLLQIDGKTLLLNKVYEDVDSAHTYIQEGPRSLDALFTVQNRVFIILILSTLIIFSGFLLIGYRLYKRKYIHPGRKQ
ncbi:DUF2334 domain-containing protein [Paenibacillus hodogayensis]|uniref:DUF2334 domain-containing protein n=1 Tax=Paenibacillus hodogayensis TaxID=279208 RepID=A0ABV5VW41_9BACL